MRGKKRELAFKAELAERRAQDIVKREELRQAAEDRAREIAAADIDELIYMSVYHAELLKSDYEGLSNAQVALMFSNLALAKARASK